MSDQSFEELVMSHASATPAAPPMVHYDPDGDCIEFLASSDSFYAKRIDHLVTVYYSQETNEIVGSLIKGVSKFFREILQRTPGFKIEVHEGWIKLEHFFTARLWSAQADAKESWVVIYLKLREVAERSGAEANLDALLAA